MRVLVIGGTGFIGPPLVRRLRAAGHDVVVFHRGQPEVEALARTIEWERAHPPARVDPAQFDYAAEDAALAALPRAGERRS